MTISRALQPPRSQALSSTTRTEGFTQHFICLVKLRSLRKNNVKKVKVRVSTSNIRFQFHATLKNSNAKTRCDNLCHGSGLQPYQPAPAFPSPPAARAWYRDRSSVYFPPSNAASVQPLSPLGRLDGPLVSMQSRAFFR